MVAAPGCAVLSDRADIGETGGTGGALSEVRVEYLAQQPGHAAAFALGARLQRFVLPVIKKYLGALHVLHHTQHSRQVKAWERVTEDSFLLLRLDPRARVLTLGKAIEPRRSPADSRRRGCFLAPPSRPPKASRRSRTSRTASFRGCRGPTGAR